MVAATQDIKCKQNLASLAPKGCFISAEAVEGAVRQIGETQKATRELRQLFSTRRLRRQSDRLRDDGPGIAAR